MSDAVDMVNTPPHYLQDPSGVECIEIMEKFASVNLAQAWRYLWRHRLKDRPVEDCDKAIWYITRYRARHTGFRAVSGLYEDEQFRQWREGTEPSLAAAAMTMLVMVDSGKMNRGSVAMEALLEIVSEVRDQAAASAPGAS